LRRFPDNVMPCGDCWRAFSLPEGMSRRAWLHLGVCVECESERLRTRILENVEVDVHGCWLWKGNCGKEGYGQFSVRGVPRAVHVVSYRVFVGPVPEGKEICHDCDVRPCCNPEHFFAGTRAENVADMWAKGRGVKPPRIAGEQHAKATLSDEQVAEIRRLRTVGVPQRTVALRFGVSQSTVWRFAHGLTRTDS